jgi:hypothetical protein
MKVERKWNEVVKVLQGEKITSLDFCKLQKLSFKSEGECWWSDLHDTAPA